MHSIRKPLLLSALGFFLTAGLSWAGFKTGFSNLLFILIAVFAGTALLILTACAAHAFSALRDQDNEDHPLDG